MNNPANVTAAKQGVGGAVYRAPITDNMTYPSKPSDTLTNYNGLGFVGEDRIANGNAPEVTEIKDMDGNVVLTIQNSKADKYTFTLLEYLNADALKTVYGESNVSVDSTSGDITIHANSSEPEASSFVIDTIVKGKKHRTVIYNAVPVLNGDITFSSTDAVKLPITLTCYPHTVAPYDTHTTFIEG